MCLSTPRLWFGKNDKRSNFTGIRFRIARAKTARLLFVPKVCDITHGVGCHDLFFALSFGPFLFFPHHLCRTAPGSCSGSIRLPHAATRLARHSNHVAGPFSADGAYQYTRHATDLAAAALLFRRGAGLRVATGGSGIVTRAGNHSAPFGTGRSGVDRHPSGWRGESAGEHRRTDIKRPRFKRTGASGMRGFPIAWELPIRAHLPAGRDSPWALLDDIPACAITLTFERGPRCRLPLKKRTA